MKRILTTPILLLLAMAVQAKVEVGNLTVEGRRDPLGLDESSPRLGWQIWSDENDIMQISYRIIVSSSTSRAEALDGDVWDSGDIPSQTSQWIAIPRQLKPNTEYFWRVKSTTNNGDTMWSPIGRWSTGMMSTPWKGCWIGTDSLFHGDSMAKHSRVASRYLRKTFTVSGDVKRATAHICGLGLYKFEINGVKAGNAELAPDFSIGDVDLVRASHPYRSVNHPHIESKK